MRKDVKHIALLLCALLWSAASLYARMYNANEKVFINVKQSDGVGDWSQSNAKLFLYFFQSTNPSNSEWVELSRVEDGSKYFIGTITPNHPWFDRVSVVRKSEWGTAGNWDERWNQSCDIKIPDNGEGDYNLLYEFKTKNNIGDNCTITTKWYYYPVENPTFSSVIANIEKEIAEVCTQSSGDPLSLQPRLINETDGYDYDQEHTWFKWNGEKWIELPNSGDWGFNGPGGLNETIGTANSHTYYFLLSAKASTKQRFIEISVTKDCSPSCEITDFGVVTSSVNVHDSTYVLEGVVAFGESLGKTLRISVTDAKGEHHVDYNAPTTPFIFSLPELYADGAELTATASFIGGGSECTRNSDPYPAPNAISGINTTTINVTHGETPTLTPSTPGTDGFKWHDGNTTDHDRVVPAYCFDTTVIYTYYEYEPKPTFAGNLIDNGDFSADESYYGEIKRSNDVTGCDISDYNFWGKEVTTESNFYDKYMDGGNSLFGGFSIVTDANSFWKRYTKKIDAKAGTYYALFDADNTGSKKAWYTNTGKSSKLKLVKGTNYMFSFWVANINNYGEMNNAAKLQFAIRYKQDGAWSEEELLGNPIDLNEYKDNIWHQNSHVYTSPVDADEVEIMVRDLNTSKNPGGNDFALDDIQFQAISVHSQAIKNCERFIVNIKEPDITVNKPKIDILKTPACGKTDFELQVQVSYSKLSDKCPANTITLQLTDDIYGDIFTTPITIDPILNPEGIILTLSSATYAMLVADGKDHNLTVTITRKDGQGKEKSWQNTDSYTAPGVPALTVTAPIVPKPDCDQTTFDLEVKTTYAYQSGTELLFYWDGDLHTEASKSISYGPSSTITTKLTGLTYDGKKHTLLVHTDNTTLDCQDSKDVDAPFSPRIYDFTATPEQMDCDEKKYNVTVTFFVTNGQGKEVTVWGKEDQHTTFAAKEGENTVKFEDVAIDAADDYFDIWFVEAEANCLSKKTAKYDEPVTPKISIAQGPEVGDMDCNLTTYTVKFDITHTNQSGKLYGWIDDDIANKIEFDYEKNPATVTFTEVPGDGLTHTLHAEFDGENSCSLEIPDFKAPFTPVISDVQIKRSEMKCGETTFNVTVEATLSENAKGHKLTITGDTGKDEPVTYDITDTKFSEVFTLDRDKATGKFFIYFADANNCEPQKHTYDPPKVPNLDVNPVVITAPKCDQTTFDLIISGSYTYLRGTEFHFLWDGVEKAKQTITSLATEKPVSATLTGLAYDGQKHVLTVQSDETTYDICPFEQTDIEVPFSPDIKSTVAKVLPYVCDAPNYQVTITVTYEKTQGHDLIITDEAGHEKTLKATDAEYGETSASWTFDMPWEKPVVEHTFKAYFEGAEGCKDEDSHKGTYTAFEQPKLTGDTTALYCNNSSFKWHGTDYTTADMPITYTYKSKVYPECDSIVTLTLTELSALTGDTTATITKGSYFKWHGVDYNAANTPATFTYTSKVAPYCDSIVTLTVNEIEALVGDTFATFCHGTSFTWYGTEYFTSGTPTHTLKSKVDTERDSVVILHLTELDLITGDTTAYYCYGLSFKWHGVDYTTADIPITYTCKSKVHTDCDSIVTLKLIERPLLAEDTIAYYCQGHPFEWYGNSYTADVTPPTHTFTSKQYPECDSIVTLRLTELPTLHGDTTATITKGSFFTWHGVDYNSTNTPTHTYTSKVTGCDSIVTLTINEIEALVGDTFATFCHGSSFTWYGTEYFSSGTHTHTLKSKVQPEQDSIVTLHLTELDLITGDTTAYYCSGGSFKWHGTDYTTADMPITYTCKSKVHSDCDSIVTLTLIERPLLAEDTIAYYCQGYAFEWYGNSYTADDTPPTHTFTSKQFPECDSIVTLRLTELPTLTGDTTATITKGSYFKWHGVDYNATNTPTHTYTSKVTGCDSIVTLTINEIDALVGDTFATFCHGTSFTWYGTEYFTSGSHTHTLKSKVDTERDSVVILHLTELDLITGDTTAYYCQGYPFEWYGNTYTINDPAPTHTFTSKQFPECDSIVSLQLIEFPTLHGDTTATITKGSYFKWHGVDYNATNTPTHTYTSNVTGCDSIVTLTINEIDALVGDTFATFCKGSSFTWYGTEYFTSGTHTHTLKSKVQTERDSVVILHLTELQPTDSIEVATISAGETYTWHGQTFTESTEKKEILTNAVGCDSVCTLILTVLPTTTEIVKIQPTITPTTDCDGTTYDLSVTFEYINLNGTLSVDLDGTTADNITPIVPDSDIPQTATATFSGLTADGQKHTLTVQTTGGVHNCHKSVTVDAPQAEDIITSVEVTDVPEDIRCDQTEYDVTITVTMSSDKAIGKKIIIAHEGKTDDFIVTANPMEVTVKMTTIDATGLTLDAYFNGHPECKATSKTFDAPKRLSCVKNHEKLCQGDSYTWPVTGLTYGPFTEAGMDTFVNALNVLDTLIVTVYPTYNMPEEQVTIIDGETFTWNGKDYEAEGIYKENLLSEHDCDSIVTLNLTVKENIVEDVSFTIAEQCAGPGALEIVIHHTGALTDARLTFSPEAVAAGFVNDTYPIEKDTVTVPYNVKAGIFSVNIDLLFHSRLKHSSIEPFTLLFPRTVLEQGWMDAIFVLTHDYNGGYDFTDFQWYKKGQMLVGETGPYLYQPLEVGAEYSAMLTEVSGLKLMTCPLIVTEHTDITLYPTVVTRKDLIHVNVSQDARLTLYSIMGERFDSYSLRSGDTQINAPGTQGIYLAEIVLESGQRKVIKIMVR